MYNVFDVLNPEVRVAAVSQKGKLFVTWDSQKRLSVWRIDPNGFDEIDSKQLGSSEFKFKDIKKLANSYLKEFTPIIPQVKSK